MQGAREGWLGQGERENHWYARRPKMFTCLIWVSGVTNQRETCVAWSRKTGKPLCKAIVWTDSRNKNLVAHYEQKLKTTGVEVSPGKFVKGENVIRDMYEVPRNHVKGRADISQNRITPFHILHRHQTAMDD
jgi:hypothetical protein